MPHAHPRLQAVDRRASLALVLEVGLALRVAAADAVQWAVGRRGRLCVFDDADIYWQLAGSIARGWPFEVSQYGVPHAALRTPGYPLFLAACRLAFGDRPLAARLVQAVAGTAGVWVAYRLMTRVAPGDATAGRWTAPLLAAALVSVEPYVVGASALLLSEALFIPLMLAMLWGLAALWPASRGWVPAALATGAAAGAAILCRPSWALFVPAALAAWVVVERRAAVPRALVVAAAAAAVMAPWWLRNARVFGRLVPTALWLGASLYDGLGPQATGASDMAFLEAPDLIAMDESSQDAALTRRSIAAARADPARVARLALAKAARFWSPWPNADAFASPGLAAASAAITLPVFALIGVGLWDRRRDARALVLLAGPLAYFCCVHMVFVSSIRYRVAGLAPALGLAAIGLRRVAKK